MFSYVRGIVNCAKGQHERAENSVRKVGDDYFGRCRYCRQPMRRIKKRDWVIDRSVTDA